MPPPADDPRSPSGSGGRGGEGTGKDFTWLYGKNHGAEPPPDATRPIRQQPPPTAERPSAAGSANSDPVAPVPPPLAPTPASGGGRSSGGGRGRGRGPRFWFRAVLALLLIWVLFLAVTPFVTWNRVENVDFAPDGERPAEQPGTTYLMLGNDSRKNLSQEDRQRFNTGNPSTNLTDTIMLLHTGDGPNVLLSIPRDSIVEVPGSGSTKINSVFARGGVPLLVETLESETGIRIDEYVGIGLDGVAGVVDAVGGIEICPRERLNDPLAGLNVKKGCQEADGEVALAYSRSRKQSALGDLERVRRQREVVSSIGSKVVSPWTVINPVRWWRLNSSVPGFFTFGEGTGPIDAARWALAMTRVDGTNGLTCTMPVTDNSAETWDRERADPLFATFIEDRTDDITNQQCTPNGIPRN